MHYIYRCIYACAHVFVYFNVMCMGSFNLLCHLSLYNCRTKPDVDFTFRDLILKTQVHLG